MEGAVCEGGSRRVLLVSAGASHTVALLSGNVVCSWGRGEDGQLGHGDAEDRHKPTIISALDGCGITSVICGADHTTAYADSRLVVYSWGWGDFGRLGHGNSSDLFIPHPIKLLYGLEIKQIACGDSHCLAVTRDGEVQSWGRNQNGQLGLGNTEDSLVPQKIQAFEGLAIKMVAAGAEHTVAVSEDGKLYGWGWGRYGNLGLADRNDRFIPEEVAAINEEKFSMVACGWRHTIAVSDLGNLYTYGWSKYGQLGHGDYEDHLFPCRVEGLRNAHIAQISGGWRHTMALDKEGQIYGWGWNKEEKFSMVACGWRHTIAVSDLGNLYTYGWSKYGQLGHGDYEDHLFPCRVEGLRNAHIAQISGGWRHTMALDKEGQIYGWGWNKFGQVGVGDNTDHCSPLPVTLPVEQKVVQVSCGWRHTVAVTDKHNVFSWGRGTSGQLGHGDINDRNLPQLVEALSADGSTCRQIQTSKETVLSGSNWISPSERYALVPDESVRGTGQLSLSSNRPFADASVPISDAKRVRTDQ